MHEDHFGARGASEAQLQSGVPGQKKAATGAAPLGPRVGKEAGSLPSSCHVEGQQKRLFLELNRWLLQGQISKSFQSLSRALMHELLA